MAGRWAQTLLSLMLTLALHGGGLCVDVVLTGIRFDARAAGGAAGQTGAAFAAGWVHIQVVTDIRLSVTLFL